MAWQSSALMTPLDFDKMVWPSILCYVSRQNEWHFLHFLPGTLLLVVAWLDMLRHGLQCRQIYHLPGTLCIFNGFCLLNHINKWRIDHLDKFSIERLLGGLNESLTNSLVSIGGVISAAFSFHLRAYSMKLSFGLFLILPSSHPSATLRAKKPYCYKKAEARSY